MDCKQLRTELEDALWRVSDAHSWVLSTTLTGSFWERPSLETVSDIDVVVVADELDRLRYETLLSAAQDEVKPILASQGYDLILNPTLGPLKLNGPRTAVLHLMLYSREAHIEHAIDSPFTCFDWQRSPRFRKHALTDIFPVFALQPQHFISGRRGLGDYLRDFRAREVSYRRLEFSTNGYREVRCSQPMSDRDAHEFAYHVMRFLMQNLVKLVTRSNESLDADNLLSAYLNFFPAEHDPIRSLFHALAGRKQTQDFSRPIENLDVRLEEFVRSFEAQFRKIFFDQATRHIIFRHARTALNHQQPSNRIFLGRSDPPIEPIESEQLASLLEAVHAIKPAVSYTSPLARCRQSLARVSELAELPTPDLDDRLLEINYGSIEGHTVASARAYFSEFFELLARGVDPRFPQGGENTHDVHARLTAFFEEKLNDARANTITCTHNVVLRCMLGATLGVPRHDWHRLEIPHLEPFVFVQTQRHGMFVDVPSHCARQVFASFTLQPSESACRS